MMMFLDESGDLGWSFEKPYKKGGSSRFVTIAGIAIDECDMKRLARYVNEVYLKNDLDPAIEFKGSKFSEQQAKIIITDLRSALSSIQIASITTKKINVHGSLQRDKSVFYNYMLNTLLTGFLGKYHDVQIIIDDRTVRKGSRNSLEDCLKAHCWGDLQIDTTITCRYENSIKNPGIWIADWLSNFIWRHYENDMHEAYLQCQAYGTRYLEKTLFL